MGRVRITRLFVLLALAALLVPRAEASRTSVWERNPPSSLTATTTDAAGLLASLAPAARLDARPLASVEAAAPPLFNLGDVLLADTADADAEHFDLGPLTLVDLNLLRGPPPTYPEPRVGGFELLPPFRVGASPSLSLWPRRACGFSCGEVVSDSRYDPWGLYSWGDLWTDVKDTGKSVGGFLSQGLLEGNGVYQLYSTVRTANALAGRTKELYRQGGASAVADAAITDVASSLPIVNTVLNASRIVDTYENQGAFEGGRQVFRTTKAAATDVAAVYGIGKVATAPEPSMSIVPEGGWSAPRPPTAPPIGSPGPITDTSRLLSAPGPVEIRFPAKGMSIDKQQAFAQHLAEQEAALNRMPASDLEMNLANYRFVEESGALDRSRDLAASYLGQRPPGAHAAHALDARAGGYLHEFSGYRDPIQTRIGSLWRTRWKQIQPGRTHRLVPEF
jgi:hypothetical protein